MTKNTNLYKIVFLILVLFILVPGITINIGTISNSNLTKRQNILSEPKVSINLEWSITDETENSYVIKDIVIDNEGYIYATGSFYNSSQNDFDTLIIKYDRAGNKIWNRTWGGNLSDEAESIACDSSNNLYITGFTEREANEFDIIIIKYNSSGHLKWNITWDSNGEDYGESIAIDQENNIYVAGITEASPMVDIVLLKFNNSGALKFSKTWGDTDTDWAYGIDIDIDGYIYITGSTHDPVLEQTNLCLLKFNKTGSLNWSKTWGGSLVDWGEAIAIDEENNIYVAANTNSYSAGWRDFALLKYNHTGGLEWNTTWGGSEVDDVNGVALDSYQNIFLSGMTKSYGGIDQDLCILKYNESGELQWNKIHQTDIDDLGEDIEIDSKNNNNIYLAGEIKGKFTLIKYNQFPDEFQLTSNVVNSIDIDGNFTLSWSDSLDANNYSLYQYNKPIVEFNESLTKLVGGNTNRTYALKNLGEDTYYFIVIAFNKYGNTSSNCLRITVQQVPGDFELMENDENPDTDGILNLTWSSSVGVYNYSIYSHTSYIHTIDNNGSLIVSGLTNNSFIIGGLTNGQYYYAIVAINPAGQTTSNCSDIIVRRKPDIFSVNSDAGNPDDDGLFNLKWSKSEYCDNYSVYYSTSIIENIDHTIQSIYNFTPEFDWPTFRYEINGKGSGVYYYRVVAFNVYGNYTSECLSVRVMIPESSSGGSSGNKVDDSFELSAVAIQVIILASSVGLLGLLLILRKKLKRF